MPSAVKLIPKTARTRAFALVAAAGVIAIAFAAKGSRPPVEERVDAVVRQWRGDFSIERAELAFAHRGKLLKSSDHGAQPTEPLPIASLSKAITAICVASLIDDGRLRLDARLGDIFAKEFETKGDPADPRFRAITVEQLLTHKAGLQKNANDDATDRSMSDSFRTALGKPLRFDPGATPSYSDTGYLVLGHVAETVAGEDYATLCGKVFARHAGAQSGPIDPTLAARAPTGGWTQSAEAYARFLNVFDTRSGGLSTRNRAWLESLPGDAAYRDADIDPAHDAPCWSFSGAPSYGFGACIRKTDRGLQFYHEGRVHYSPPNYLKRGGSFFFVDEDGYAAVVIFSGKIPAEAYPALESAVMAEMSGRGS